MLSPSAHRFDAVAAVLLTALAFLFVWASVFGGWLTPGIQDVLRAIPAGDKLGHAALYGSVTFAAALLARKWHHLLTSAVVIFMVGVLEEFRQVGMPRRAFDVLDIWANGVGIVIGAAVGIAVLFASQSGSDKSMQGSNDGASPVGDSVCPSDTASKNPSALSTCGYRRSSKVNAGE